LALQRRRHFTPGLGRDFRDLAVGHVGQASEHVAKISKGIESAAAAVFDDGVDDRAALAGIGIADEEPVFLADGRGTNGVFYAETPIMLSSLKVGWRD
jgi:hypothetical protein